MTATVTDLPDRLRARIDTAGPFPPDPYRPVLGPCWIWTGGTFPAGYGSYWLDGRSVLVHRVVYELLVGPIPGGLELDHVCRVRACCNPKHLEPVTPAENMIRTQRSRCVNGHLMEGPNLRTVKGKPGQRRCAACARDRQRLYRKRKAER